MKKNIQVVENDSKESRTDKKVTANFKKLMGRLQGLSRQQIIFIVVIILMLGIMMFLAYDRNKLKNEVAKSSSTSTSSVNEAQELKQAISQYIELSDEETPTVATVVDVNKVKNQTFFKNAQNGDKVLLFAKSGKAILYRPSTKKVIEVAPINVGNSQAQTPGTSTDLPSN